MTNDDYECANWDDETVHVHSYKPSTDPEWWLDGHNHCRNPLGSGDRTWCYTTDEGVTWAYC